MQSVQSDGGGKFHFLSKDWVILGIGYRVTFPHMSEQNGTVESKHKRVAKNVITLLQNSYLLARYWTYACKIMVYSKNRLLAKGLNFLNPY